MKPEPKRRMFAAKLDTGEVVTYLPGQPMTDREAGQAIRDKFRRGGKLMLKECGEYVPVNS